MLMKKWDEVWKIPRVDGRKEGKVLESEGQNREQKWSLNKPAGRSDGGGSVEADGKDEDEEDRCWGGGDVHRSRDSVSVALLRDPRENPLPLLMRGRVLGKERTQKCDVGLVIPGCEVLPGHGDGGGDNDGGVV